jgi:uncharacterized protein (DUF1015 family)
MATIRPFRALRPKPSAAARIAAVPYDVVSTDEARAMADGNALNFLRVSRAEIELPADTNPYSDEVYEQARRNFDALRSSSLVAENESRLYVYRLRHGGAEQTGVGGAFSIDEYRRDVIRKHERTRRDKEDDRTRHILALKAQTGPVFLMYRASAVIDAIATRSTAEAPLYDFEADDGIRHTVWLVRAADTGSLVEAFAGVPSLYIADGHHRAASAARAFAQLESGGVAPHRTRDEAGAESFLAVAFPHDQVRILPYNRVVKDLNGHSPVEFMEAVRQRFLVEPGGPAPARRGEIAMYFQGEWRILRPRVVQGDLVGVLDVSILQDGLLEPVLGIADVRTDKRIDFVGGARGTGALQRLVDDGGFVAAFSLYPVSVSDLMAVSDAGAIMPPKSTWFEPKLRDGLLIHTI